MSEQYLCMQLDSSSTLSEEDNRKVYSPTQCLLSIVTDIACNAKHQTKLLNLSSRGKKNKVGKSLNVMLFNLTDL